jgi:putative transcriptional regulator
VKETTTMRKDLFDELVQSVKGMKAIRAGRLKPARVTRVEDLSVSTLQNWEQGRRAPEGPARVLLQVAAIHPEAVLATRQQRRARARSRKHAAA